MTCYDLEPNLVVAAPQRRPVENSVKMRPGFLTCQISLVKTGWMVKISKSVRENDLSTMVNPQVNSVQ
jgi:hypothetical protein